MKRSIGGTAAIICAALAATFAAGAARAAETSNTPRGLGDLTGPWQLFIDDFLIEEKDNLTRTFHQFEKYHGNPVDIRGKGVSGGGRGTVMRTEDGKGWRRFENGRSVISGPSLTEWTTRHRPDPEGGSGNASFMHTPWDKGREYKMVSYTKNNETGLNDWEGFYSPAGSLAWTPSPGNPLLQTSNADTGRFVWDPLGQRYYGTVKIWTDVRGVMRRCVGFTSSSDFDSGWHDLEMILIPDTREDAWATEPGQGAQFYSFSAFAYETMYIGMVEVLRLSDGSLEKLLTRNGPNDGERPVALFYSRDGKRWQRPDDRAYVLPTGSIGSWDGGMLTVPSEPVIEDGQLKVLYSAGFYTHGYGRGGFPTQGKAQDKWTGLGVAMMRKDGWASLDASQHEGTVTTKVLRNVQGPLAINFVTARGRGYGTGWVKVEVLDEQGNVISGYSRDDADELRGDSLDQVVTWNGSDQLPTGQPLRFQFIMTDARLYSFRAGDDVEADAELPRIHIVHTFEGSGDGVDGVYFYRDASVSRDSSVAAFGAGSIALPEGPAEVSYVKGKPRPPLQDIRGNGLELDNAFRFGDRFTLAAQIRTQKPDGPQRLFSSYDPYPQRENKPPFYREGWIGQKEMILDFDPSGKGDSGCLRLVVHGKEIVAPGSFAPGQYHHLAATYDDGKVTLYLDGEKIGQGTAPGGEVTALVNLRVGIDSGPINDQYQGTVPNRQMVGQLDDVVVVGRALSPDEIKTLSDKGTAAVFDVRQ